MQFDSSLPPLVHRRPSLRTFALEAVEPVVIVAMLVACHVATGHAFGGAELLLALFAFALTFPADLPLSHGGARPQLFRTLASWFFVVGMLLFVGYATGVAGTFQLRPLLAWFLVTPGVVYLAQRAVPALLPRLAALEGRKTAVIVGAGPAGLRLAQQLATDPSQAYALHGLFADADADAAADAEAVAAGKAGSRPAPVLGPLEAVSAHVKAHRVDAVFLALPLVAQPRLMALLDELKDTTASVYFVPDIFITDLISARMDNVGGVPVLGVCESPIVGFDALRKRLFDLVAASLLVLLLAPLMLAIAVAIRIESPGPVIFRQRRYGLDARQIVVWKFRTMRVLEDGADVRQARAGDDRVTCVGRLLRSTSADELPQLFNVIAGSMSLVGPRPHAVAHNELYRRVIKGYMVRHKVKPGITGWAQVNGLRGPTDDVEAMRARIEYDLAYLRRWSVGFDLLILLRTARIVLSRTNAV